MATTRAKWWQSEYNTIKIVVFPFCFECKWSVFSCSWQISLITSQIFCDILGKCRIGQFLFETMNLFWLLRKGKKWWLCANLPLIHPVPKEKRMDMITHWKHMFRFCKAFLFHSLSWSFVVTYSVLASKLSYLSFHVDSIQARDSWPKGEPRERFVKTAFFPYMK